MVYLFLVLSLSCNVLLIWYIRKLMQKYWFDIEAREKFTEMLEEYAEALKSLYRLEELYGEELIKTAINQTKFVVEACKEFKDAIETDVTANKSQEEEDTKEDTEEKPAESVIRLREGEKVSQNAAQYKKVVFDGE